MSEDYPYIFVWGNNAKRAEYRNRLCKVVARGSMNSIAIQFEDRELLVTSRNAVRKVAKEKE